MDKYQDWGKKFVSDRFHGEKKGGYEINGTPDNGLITEDLVVKGIKFIIENRSLNQRELVDGLLNIGCDFTITDIMRQFNYNMDMDRGICIGDIGCGALVIVNARDSELSRDIVEERYLDNDGNYSLYHFVRMLTNNYDYTKESIERERHK